MIDPLYVASGFGVGLLVGMTGVGGGSLMTPLLILLFGIHPSTAVGTDLLYAAATKTGGSLVHGWSQQHSLAGGDASRQRQHSGEHRHAAGAVAARPQRRGRAQPGQSGAVLCAHPHGDVADLPQGDHGTIPPAHGTARRRDDRQCDRGGRRGARGAGLDFLRRRRRGRRHRAAAALSAPADGEHRRLRHRARRAADAGRRHRPLGAGFGRLGADGRAADRLAARHRHRQLLRGSRAGDGAQAVAGLRPDPGRRQACHQRVASVDRRASRRLPGAPPIRWARSRSRSQSSTPRSSRRRSRDWRR